MDSEQNIAIEEWANQLAVLKIQFNKDTLRVTYLDDENEEVGIQNQLDYDYALNLAYKNTGKFLQLVIRNEDGSLIHRIALKVVQKETNRQEDKKRDQDVQTDPLAASTACATMTTSADTSQPSYELMHSLLDKFKRDILTEMDDKLNRITEQLQEQNTKRPPGAAVARRSENPLDVASPMYESHGPQDDFETLEMSSVLFAVRIQKLVSLLDDARSSGGRALKIAYLEEELELSGAFNATFIKDCNMPDGTKCPRNAKFCKTWQLQNTGKLEWRSDTFPVKLVCIAGDIGSEQKAVSVLDTELNQTACISVELIAPSQPGLYFTEWVLSCNNFQFGPRVWCTIQVEPETGDATMTKVTTEANAPIVESADTLLVDLKDQEDYHLQLPSVRSYSSSKSSEYNKQFSDFDDDFIVVPDCFDLNKKWLLTSTSDSISKSTSRGKDDHNTSFVEVCDEPREQNDQILDLEIVEPESQAQNIQPPLTPVKLEANQKPEYPYPLKAQQQASSIPSYPAHVEQAISSEPIKQSEEATHEIDSDHAGDEVNEDQLSAFNLVKNAFTNLRGPLYLGNLDLEYKRQEEIEASSISELVSMGFADRVRNKRLLRKHNNDIDKVIEDLLEKMNDNWSLNRH